MERGLNLFFFILIEKIMEKELIFFLNHNKNIKKKDLNFLFGPANP